MGRGKRRANVERVAPLAPGLTPLTADRLQSAAVAFVDELNSQDLRGTVGKEMATSIERQLHERLSRFFDHTPGNSASGADLPALGYDIKVTSMREPQSSAAYNHPAEKLFGLPYGVIVLPYETEGGRLVFKRPIVLAPAETADRRLTEELRRLVADGARQAEIIAFLRGADLGLGEQELRPAARRILQGALPRGRVTLSAARQWRVRYREAIAEHGRTHRRLTYGNAFQQHLARRRIVPVSPQLLAVP
jgi:hypothetical protein